jgi:hypothetical protein
VRSRPDLLLLAVLALAPSPSPAQPDPAEPVGEAPSRVDVQKALDKVENDPNLAAERTIRMLKWAQPEPVTDEPWWWQWLNALARWFRGFFDWMAESGRYVVWVLGALLAGLLLFYLVRLVRARGVPRVPKPFMAPSHVRDLDIRPESLPEDIGAAARALWDGGEERAALALLYRGLLSRLVHAQGVPIRASSTEGECLALARPRLAAQSAAYAAKLIETWAAAVYGGLGPAPSAVHALCAEFAPALDGRAGAAA